VGATTATRELGFREYQTTDKASFAHFAALRARRLIP
jgi:hypothetical protein